MASFNPVSAGCVPRQVELIIIATDPDMTAVQDDLVRDLAKIGINLTVTELERDAYIEKERNGDFNMLLTRTWGAPYDPHSYLESWQVASHVEYSILGGLEPPLTREDLLAKIEAVQSELEPTKIQEKWKEVLNDIHQQAMFVPLWGTRVPYVVSRRLSGFSPSDQTYSYPLSTVRVLEGSKTITVLLGSGGEIFTKLGPTNPHQYFPNQPFALAWVYEGLVAYGQDGEIVPALATSWTTENKHEDGGGQTVTFTLREGVKFHDGTAFNCTVAKLNFDHVLSDTVKQRHAWYGTSQRLTNWEYNAQVQFVLETDTPFYPLLQELTYIRPLVFASAAAFAEGVDSHPDKHNSCNPGDFGSKWDHLEENITCAGLTAPLGTGPFKYVSTDSSADGSIDNTVVFARHDDYWGTVPDIEELHIKHFDDTIAIEEALLDGSLDMALGIGPLTATQVQDLKFFHSDVVDVRHSDVLQHAVLVINTNSTPTDDIAVRKAIIHATDKSTFVEKEFAGLERTVGQLLPDTAPYCNVDLSPQWGFDMEKARFLNCGRGAQSSPQDDGLSAGAIGGISVAVLAGIAMVLFIIHIIQREKEGKPIFAPPKEGTEVA